MKLGILPHIQIYSLHCLFQQNDKCFSENTIIKKAGELYSLTIEMTIYIDALKNYKKIEEACEI